MKPKRKQSRDRWSRTEKLMLIALIIETLFEVLDRVF